MTRAYLRNLSSRTTSAPQWGGSASFLQPKISDLTSILRQAYDLLITPHVKLVVAIRDMVPIGTAAAAGQVWSVYRVITDADAGGWRPAPGELDLLGHYDRGIARTGP